MPPRKRAAPKPPPLLPLRAALEADLADLELPDHRALIELARVLADALDTVPPACEECGGRDPVAPPLVLRYADALEALGIGRIAQQEPEDGFTVMVKGFGHGSP